MGYEEIFTLLLVSYATRLKIRVIFPYRKCLNIGYGSQNFLPHTFKNSYIWPLQYANLENLPMTFEFMRENYWRRNNRQEMIEFRIDNIDVIGGSVKLGPFMQNNAHATDFKLPYFMTLAFANQVPYPVIRQPIEVYRGVYYFTAFDGYTWILISVALILISSLVILSLNLGRSNYEMNSSIIIAIQLILGFVRPSEYDGYVKKPSKAESMLILFWFTLAMFIHILYNTDFRSMLIGQEFETPFKDYRTSNPFEVQIVLPFGGYFEAMEDSGETRVHEWLRETLFDNQIVSAFLLNFGLLNNRVTFRADPA